MTDDYAGDSWLWRWSLWERSTFTQSKSTRLIPPRTASTTHAGTPWKVKIGFFRKFNPANGFSLFNSHWQKYNVQTEGVCWCTLPLQLFTLWHYDCGFVWFGKDFIFLLLFLLVFDLMQQTKVAPWLRQLKISVYHISIYSFRKQLKTVLFSGEFFFASYKYSYIYIHITSYFHLKNPVLNHIKW